MAEGGTLDVNLDTLANQALELIKGLPNFEYELQQFILSGRKHVTILLCGKNWCWKITFDKRTHR